MTNLDSKIQQAMIRQNKNEGGSQMDNFNDLYEKAKKWNPKF